ncbi:MAG: pyridoxal phosphate-dependent aminotransferase [Gemmatimonadota bacterium]
MNHRIASIPASLIRSINAKKRPGDIDLGLGEPTLAPDMDAFAAAMEWTRANGSPYSPNAGFTDLRSAVARYLGSGGWAAGPPGAENVCVTVGSEEALFLAIKTVVDSTRDEVLIVEPCYLAYPKICLLEGIRHRMVALSAAERFQPRAETVLNALRPETRLIVINTPCNPTGRVWPEGELRALGEALRAREGREIYVLADEVYRELYFGAAPPASIAEFHPWTLIAGSVSKSNALTGLRLGWLAGPREAIEPATKVHQFLNTSASTFSQRVAFALLDSQGGLAAHRQHYVEMRRRLLDAARESAVELITPEGAFYAFVRLPADMARDSVAAAESLLQARRVVCVPGRAFGESGEGWLRLSWVVAPDIIEEGVRRIGEWIAGTA